ncbi:OmpA family protein [Gemmatimonas aurantiaca]|nr:OmpA family protein [Gemmatimonas aurantiaca]
MKKTKLTFAFAISVTLLCFSMLPAATNANTESPEQLLRKELFHAADSLLEISKKTNARKFAPRTNKAAFGYLLKADSLFKQYQATTPEIEEALYYAEYHFRHALAITRKVRGIKKRNDQAYEKQILEYEALLAKIAQARNLTLSFESGAIAPTDILVHSITALSDSLTVQLKREADFLEQLRKLCVDIGVTLSPNDSLAVMIEKLGLEFSDLVQENDQLRTSQRQITETLEQTTFEKETAARLLAAREEEERKYADLRALFDPKTEALVMSTASKDIVIRLRGLIFQSGTSDLRPSHDSLLAKVIAALEIIPGKKVIIEGHTDNTGGVEANRKVSRKRAQSVMSYLVIKTGRPPSDFEALGYGADKPVANNQSERGRADNRRIDIVILR